MDTFPEPFTLRNPSAVEFAGRGFRVPFGLRDGRVFTPHEVPKGQACGCICPGCHSPLIAMAQDSRCKRAYFAHLRAGECRTGRETGIHLRAKQLIVETAELLIPEWNGDLLDMPNPPTARDDEGTLHRGQPVLQPALREPLSDVQVEPWFGAYRPDLSANGSAGAILIEIRVTHAVGARKASRVEADGLPMIEIDLSGLDPAIALDADAFAQAVLFDPANRYWISCPAAVAAWRASKAELDERISERNRWLAEQRATALALETARIEREARAARDKAGRRDYVRNLERRKHAADLAQLVRLTNRDRIEGLLRDYQAEAAAKVTELLNAAPASVRSACQQAHRDAWIFGVDPVLWQLLAYDRFVGGRPIGNKFNQQDMARWVRLTFPSDRVLYRLFKTQYVKRAEARRAGYAKRKIGFWAFTDAENALVPNFYAPINDFIFRLTCEGLVRRLPEPIGECEVVGP